MPQRHQVTKTKEIECADTDGEKIFFRLYERWDDVYAYVLRMVKDNEVARDIVQDVFVRLWEQREKLSGYVKDAEQFLFRMGKNEAIDFLRRERLKEMCAAGGTSGIRGPLCEIPGEREIEQLLQKALLSLTEQRKRVFVLGRLEGWSRMEIATVLGISEHTVRNLMREALRDLRSVLGLKENRSRRARSIHKGHDAVVVIEVKEAA